MWMFCQCWSHQCASLWLKVTHLCLYMQREDVFLCGGNSEVCQKDLDGLMLSDTKPSNRISALGEWTVPPLLSTRCTCRCKAVWSSLLCQLSAQPCYLMFYARDSTLKPHQLSDSGPIFPSLVCTHKTRWLPVLKTPMSHYTGSKHPA